MLLFVILVLVLSFPSVQTSLAQKVTKLVNDDFGTKIHIDRIGLKFNGDVALKQIYIEDYKNDTLIGINELNTSVLSFRNLYNNKLTFGDVDINGLVFNIKTYKGETKTNLDEFIAKFEEDNPKVDSKPFLLSSSDISVYDGTFRLIDENKEKPKIIEFDKLYLNATNFLIKKTDISVRINNLAFIDSRGVVVKNMVANFDYTPTHLYFDNLKIATANSNLNGKVRFDYEVGGIKDLTNKARVDAVFRDSEVFLDEMNTFYNEFGTDQKVFLNV
ncbi:MAG TPA: translocation/assembly module TamB, partial [Aquaticitalea sp.]|nr:translocation/assembly module TamB [Aquaticitalea sp.]